MVEEIKKESKPGNGKAPEQPLAPPTDFKIAEIWIRNGQLMLDAPESFWEDKFRALGVLLFCQEIVKEAKIPVEKNKIIQPKGAMMDFMRNGFRKKK